VLVSVVIGMLLVALFLGSVLAAFLITLVILVSTVARIRTAVQRRKTARGLAAPHHMEGASVPGAGLTVTRRE
jgi:uncharacterized membrane protein HdeD (DUF308 family)